MADTDWQAEYLWADNERLDDRAPPLRTYVSRLRSSFTEAARDWILTEPGGYRLTAPPAALEHRRFTTLRAEARHARDRNEPQAAPNLLNEAQALWRGAPFRELEDLHSAQAEIAQLELDRLEMLEERWVHYWQRRLDTRSDAQWFKSVLTTEVTWWLVSGPICPRRCTSRRRLIDRINSHWA